ncbi:MAG: hypothetical protein IKR19_08095 [Acholeplasmatales bacterium]|nr:hypothetical protein [Acholeplasmatales bacterium]
MAWDVLDVSKYQSISDYVSAAASVSGVLIRVGYRGYGASGTLATDTKFKSHYNGFLGNTKIGFYFTTTAITRGEVKAEADYFYNLIKDKQCDFPVYIYSDFANSSHNGRSDNLSVDERTNIVNTWCKRMKELGYRVGIIATDYWFGSKLKVQEFYDAQYSLIVANYDGEPSNVTVYDGWQYTDSAVIPKYNGVVRLSHIYRDIAGWTEGGTSTDPVDINNISIDISPTVFTYSNEYLTPTVTVGSLQIGIDYTVEYAHNKAAGVGTVTITGIGNYTGTTTRNFTILPQDLNANNRKIVFATTAYAYTGEEVIPDFYVPNLNSVDDYDVDIRNNIEVGTGVVTLTGKGNYTGTLVGNFNIISGDITLLDGWALEYDEVVYDGYAKEPKVIPPIGLVFDKDYKIASYRNNTDVGTATVTINGFGNYIGTVRLYFNIIRTNIIGNITLTPSSFVYSGEECRPQVAVENLAPDEYAVEYQNNINAGQAATVVLYGIKNHTNTITGYFVINPKNINDLEDIPDSIEDQYYNAGYVEPPIELEGLTKNTDYYLRYTDNHNIGTGFVTITGMGNYTGTRKLPFNIVQCPIDRVLAKYGTPSAKTPYRLNNGILTLTMDDYPLKENIDYKIINRMEEIKSDEGFILLTLVVEGLAGFVGIITYRYRVINQEPTSDYEDDGTFNYGDIDEDDETAVGNYDFGNLDEDPEDPDDPSDCIPGGDYNFEAFSGIYLDEYDEDDGTNIDEQGHPIVPVDPEPEYDDDDGKFNYGDIDLEDETAEGDWDFGDLDEGTDMDSVVPEGTSIDFNIESEGFPAGKEVDLEDTPIYANYCSTVPVTTKTGTYFIYKPQVVNNMIRITKMESGVDVPVRCTGWVKLEDLRRLGKPKVGDPVYVDGRLRRYINSDNEYIEVHNMMMYVVMVANESEYEYPYAMAYDAGFSRIGWASIDMLTKPEIVS